MNPRSTYREYDVKFVIVCLASVWMWSSLDTMIIITDYEKNVENSIFCLVFVSRASLYLLNGIDENP